MYKWRQYLFSWRRKTLATSLNLYIIPRHMKTLNAKKRDGNESTSYIRNEEKYIPAVLYGDWQNISVKVPDNVFRSIYSDIREGAEFNLELEGDKTYQVVLKDMQVHPTTGFVLHIDFFIPNKKEA